MNNTNYFNALSVCIARHRLPDGIPLSMCVCVSATVFSRVCVCVQLNRSFLWPLHRLCEFSRVHYTCSGTRTHTEIVSHASTSISSFACFGSLSTNSSFSALCNAQREMCYLIIDRQWKPKRTQTENIYLLSPKKID